MKDPIRWWLGSDFTFIITCLVFITCCGLLLLFIATPRKRRPKARRARECYDDGYVSELLTGGTLLPFWGHAAPCPHDGWTRSFDVVMKGGDSDDDFR